MVRLTQVLLGYWEKYVAREMYQGYYSYKPIRGWKQVKQKYFHFNEHRPWTDEWKRANAPGSRRPQVLVEPIREWKFFKGDRVEVLHGRDKGKQGIINCIIKERNWAFVEGLNCKYEMRQSHPDMPATCLRSEMPLLVTKHVRLIDPSDSISTEVEWRFTEQGEKVRVATRTGRIIPLPKQANELPDGVQPEVYMEQEHDTKEAELTEITFKPSLTTFEQDLMGQYGIKEDRVPAKTYWY